MKRQYTFGFICWLLLPAATGFSQDSVQVVKTSEQSIEFVFDGFVASDAVTNRFIKAFYRGEFIDSELKGQVSEGLAFENRLGGELRTGVAYSYHSLAAGWKPTFSFSYFDRQHLALSFSKDLFDLVFYGNKMFAGDTARLWNFRAHMLHYEQFRFGWKWKGDASHGSFGFAFSLLSGDRDLYLDGNTSGLYTAADGSYLSLPLRMDVFQTDTAKTGYFSQNGMGLSADLFYELPYLFRSKPGRITFAINDLGVIGWNRRSLHYSVDTFYYFSGITVSDLVHLDSNAFSSSNTDRLIERNSKIKRGSYSTMIPATLDIHTKTDYGKTFSLEKGFKYYFNTSAMPYFYLKFYFNTGRKQWARFGYIAGYGGYGKFHTGVSAEFDLGKHYTVALADHYFFSAAGMGGSLRITRKF